MNSIILANFPIRSRLKYNRYMKKHLSSLLPNDLYHSYIVEGDTAVLTYELRDLLIERGDLVPQSPDLFLNTYDAFTIADSGAIKEWHNSFPVGTAKKVCILGAQFINYEAQQSLLKIIEEPHENTHFFLVVPQAGLLLETIRSRTHTISTSAEVSTTDIKKFISSSLADRLAFIAALVEKYKDKEGSGGLRHEATVLINGLELNIYEKFKKDPTNTDIQFVLGQLTDARTYASTPGASVKMILEHLSLVI